MVLNHIFNRIVNEKQFITKNAKFCENYSKMRIAKFLIFYQSQSFLSIFHLIFSLVFYLKTIKTCFSNKLITNSIEVEEVIFKNKFI